MTTKFIAQSVALAEKYEAHNQIINEKLKEFSHLGTVIYRKVFTKESRTLTHTKAKVLAEETLLGGIAYLVSGGGEIVSYDDKWLTAKTRTGFQYKLPINILSYSVWDFNKTMRNNLLSYKWKEELKELVKRTSLKEELIETSLEDLKNLKKIAKTIEKKIALEENKTIL